MQNTETVIGDISLDFNPDGFELTEENQTSQNEPESFADLLNKYDVWKPHRGELVEGTILMIERDIVLVDVGAKRDAVVPHQDLNRLDADRLERMSVGDEVPVYVLRTPNGHDDLEVSIKRGLEQQDWMRAEEYLESGAVQELQVTGYNKGGILAAFGNLSGFVPNSHVPELRHVRDIEQRDEVKAQLIGTTLPLQVIEVNRPRRRLVLSAKAAQYILREQRLKELEAGDVVHGIVESIADFGAFVNLGGITGLIHISRLDWQHVNHPSDVVNVGDDIEVLVENVDLKRGRVRLNRQALLPDPWELVAEKYSAGDMVNGRVTNVVEFGAFVQLPPGVEGLVHVSEIPDNGLVSPQEMLRPGDVVHPHILDIDLERKRIRLSLRQGTETPVTDWTVVPAKAEEAE